MHRGTGEKAIFGIKSGLKKDIKAFMAGAWYFL